MSLQKTGGPHSSAIQTKWHIILHVKGGHLEKLKTTSMRLAELASKCNVFKWS